MRVSISPEYKKFLEEELIRRKLSFYEKFCKFFSFVKLPLPKKLKEKYEEEIAFTHLNLIPEEIFSSSIIFPFILSFFTFLLTFFGLPIEFFVMILVLSLLLFYFLLTYPHYYKFLFRTKASSEMMLAIVYLVIATRIYKSIDKALAFAAKNLTGPLGMDFKEALWDVYSGEKLSVYDALDSLAKKWEFESEEFSEALSLIKVSLSSKNPEKNLENALNLILSSTVMKMESYGRKMKMPVTLVNMFGILLPLLGLIIFPILFLMIPEIARPEMIAFIYNVMLFLVVYLFLRQSFFIRPYSFHQPELAKLEKITKWKKRSLLISFGLGIILLLPLLFLLFSKPILVFNEQQFFISVFIIISLFSSFILYNFLIYFKNSKKNKIILEIESELPIAIRELSSILRTGKPIEGSLKELVPKIKNLEIRKFFEKILANIRQLGLTFPKAIFDKNFGAIKEYPSRMLNAIMTVIVEIGEKGAVFLADALDAISRYLTDAKNVSEKTKSILEEVTYNVQVQSLVLAPLTAGIVVGLTVFTLAIFFYLGGSLQTMQQYFEGIGTLGDIASGGILGLLNFTDIISVPYFQLIVGIYLLEISLLMAYFYGEIVYGDDEISKSYVFGKTLVTAVIIYVICVIAIYFGIKSFINIEEFAKMVKI